jgi:putative SOS response-associated peptidase YedK
MRFKINVKLPRACYVMDHGYHVAASPLHSSSGKSRFAGICSDFPLFTPRYNIAPSQELPVIVRNEDRNEVKQIALGLVPSWAPDPSIASRIKG